MGREDSWARRPFNQLALAFLVCPTALSGTDNLAGVSRANAATQEQQQTCTALADQKIEDVNLLSATIVPASSEHAEYCRVLGYVRPAINFEVRLPTANWNNKFYMSGCPGLCGFLRGEAAAIGGRYLALNRGYAVALTDTGHWGRDMGDGRWAYNNLQAREDYAFRAVTETVRVGKLVATTFYGRDIERSYFQGCSGGGRQALVEAQRFPADFDGIIAGCAVTDITGFVAQWIWNIQVDTGEHRRPIFDSAKLELLASAVLQRCADSEGVIADPRRCNFQPSQLQCRRKPAADCLTRAEVEVVNRWYQGPRLRSGAILHEGLPRGSERDWAAVVVNHAGADALMNAYVRYLILDPSPGHDFQVADFDLATDLTRAAPMLDALDANNPDLSAFRARGGKLLMYSGWADAAATPGNMISYYERVGGANGRDEVRDFVRLFLVPGMGHLPDGIDPLTALERWVEAGEAPTFLLRTKRDAKGSVQWTRPACAYPEEAEYTGKGDRRDASNWRCVERTR